MPPKLQITDVKPSWTNPVPPNTYIWIDVYVKNVGDTDSGTWWVVLVDDDTEDLIDKMFVASIPPGQEVWVQFSAYSDQWVTDTKRNMRIEVGIEGELHDVWGCKYAFII